MSLNGSQLIDTLEARFNSAGGQMSFQKFMEMALYDPEFGYYTTHIQGVGGRSADFTTWTSRANLLSEAITSWIKAELLHHQWEKKTFHLIEVGGGSGDLTKQILSQLNWRTRKRLNYHIVDVSKPLQQQQRTTLRKFRNIQWHDDIAAALRTANQKAIVFSNELVDAFPANWYRWDGQWYEIMLHFDRNTGLSERFEPTELSMSESTTSVGQRIEKHWSYQNWLESWASQLYQGSILTVDYGQLNTQTLYKNKLNGTLRGYYKHQLIEGGDIYKRVGKQDLTCDVNFSELKQWGEQLGWQTIALEDQLSFFRNRIPTLQCTPQEIDAAKQFYVLNQRALF